LQPVLERYGILGDLKRIGSQHFGACPIHRGSNKKQFVCDLEKNLWRCFGDCNRGGSTIRLVSEIEHIEIRAAAELIASWFAIGKSSRRDVQHRKPKEKAMSGERPSHKAFVVEDRQSDGDEGNAFWTRVGSAWPHKDGKGLNVQLASGVAVSGRLVLREYSEEDAAEDDKKTAAKRKK
jgi:CHC2 zinc finger